MSVEVSIWSMHPSAGRGVAVVRREGGAVVGVSDATLSGYDVDFDQVADPVLGAVLGGLREEDGVSELRRAFTSVPEWLGLTAQEQQLENSFPHVQLAVACCSEREASIAWVGASKAWLYRDHKPSRSTEAHVISPELHPQGLFRWTPARWIDRERSEPEDCTWSVFPGDRLILLSSSILRRTGWNDGLPEPLARATADEMGQRARSVARAKGWDVIIGAIAVVEWT
ncbi:MAG: hypothetical protein AAGF12_17355 [Myxococcota bacterium]